MKPSNGLLWAGWIVAVLWGLVGCEDQPAAERSPAGAPGQGGYVGGPMPLREATMVADRAGQELSAGGEVDPKVRQAFREEIVQMLAHGEASRRAASARALGELRRPAAVEALYLASGVGEPDRTVRTEAVNALGWIGKADTALIVSARLEDPAVEVRQAAADALGRLANPQAEPFLVEALDDPEVRVRVGVARSLGLLRDPRAVEPLLGALQDASAQVRASAAGALGRLGDARAVVPLIHMLNDASPLVRYQAVGALGALGDRRAIEPVASRTELDPDEQVRNRARDAVAHLRGLHPEPAEPSTAPAFGK